MTHDLPELIVMLHMGLEALFYIAAISFCVLSIIDTIKYWRGDIP